MTDADRDAMLYLLEAVVTKVAVATRWQCAYRALPPNTPPLLYQRMGEMAVQTDDEAGDAVNAFRAVLGADPLPHPSDPPAARPDDA
jgi:hypothetical protein